MKDKVVQTYSISSHRFFCENCGRASLSTNTTMRIYRSGIEVQIDHCDGCRVEQETEFFAGPTVSVQNKEIAK